MKNQDKRNQATMSHNPTAIPGSDVGEVLFNFTQRCFIGESNNESLDMSAEESLFKRLSTGPITTVDVFHFAPKQKRMLREILTQYIMFLQLNQHLPFPSGFLDDSSQDQIGHSLLSYICDHRWPFPQMLPLKR